MEQKVSGFRKFNRGIKNPKNKLFRYHLKYIQDYWSERFLCRMAAEIYLICIAFRNDSGSFRKAGRDGKKSKE